ncbi:MAG: glycosyl hydrolase 115 family protein [Bacteroidales bacterium]|nr:glycosyl hydrolase 115 family protein [Bacteroidales bacterium]MCF8389860.1 glycosyl hydrolase 115 family protein [Bacteroidales bacterium]
MRNIYSIKIEVLRYFLLAILFISNFGNLNAIVINEYVTEEYNTAFFPLFHKNAAPVIYVGIEEFPGVQQVIRNFQSDFQKVCGVVPGSAFIKNQEMDKFIIIMGTIGKNPLIDELIKTGKIEAGAISGQWESFQTQVVKNPFKGVKMALVISGSDKRGTMYGIYDLAEQIGVSPWHWWADVPVKMKKSLYVLPNVHSLGEPAVKYRGIFLNDEAPAIQGWAEEKFGGLNHQFYEHVFELIIRLKANYLWPAMWGNAFYDDDPLNPELADEYGVVIGTSHHEPLMRAHDEWRRYGEGPWNYTSNEEKLKEFWTTGIERMGKFESLITVGMRGDGDEPMTEGTAIELLEKIVADQRSIISDVTKKNIQEVPQVWALYKEVQDYYDFGMEVPEDISLLLCDDNWGNLRRLPKPGSPSRKGGYGIYYHFDFVGGPRSYKWINTTQIERVWEQMSLAYNHGADRIWIVNVGDLKPMEFPISFFLDFAWAPDQWPAERLSEYYKIWAGQQFGEEFSEEIAEIIAKYTKFNARRKPEMLSPETYSLINFNEAETIVNEYHELEKKAKNILNSINNAYKDAFYQLVYHPVAASANLNELYFNTGKNHLYADQGRRSAELMSMKVKENFKKDSLLTEYFHKNLSEGKWNHFMDQTHIGYTYWNQPEHNTIPDLRSFEPGESPEMGIAIEGMSESWPGAELIPELPAFDKINDQEYYIDIFNRGSKSFDYKITAAKNWLLINKRTGKIDMEDRIFIKADWKSIPEGMQNSEILVSSSDGSEVTIHVKLDNRNYIVDSVFFPDNGIISIEACDFQRNTPSPVSKWIHVPNSGRTASAMAMLDEVPDEESAAELSYCVFIKDTGMVNITSYVSPGQNLYNDEGGVYEISIDGDSKLVYINRNDSIPDWKYPDWWNKVVGDNIRKNVSQHKITKPGKHELTVKAYKCGIVLQKIIISEKDIKPSYLGPPGSKFITR